MSQLRGIWIWELDNIRPDYIEACQKCHVGRVYLKIFDDASSPCLWKQCSSQVISKFKNAGIELYGWGYHFDKRTQIDVDEAESCIKKAVECGIEGYIVDVEREVKNSATHDQLKELLIALRRALGGRTLGYTSYGYPRNHPEVPWQLLNDLCDIQMPQIYVEKFTFGPGEPGPQENLREIEMCLESHRSLGLTKPILPLFSSESNALYPASATELQSWLDKYEGSAIWRVPKVGERGYAWDLDYHSDDSSPIVVPARDKVTWLEGYRDDNNNNIVVAWAENKPIEIVQLIGKEKENLVSLLRLYKNAKNFEISRSNQIPEGEITQYPLEKDLVVIDPSSIQGKVNLDIYGTVYSDAAILVSNLAYMPFEYTNKLEIDHEVDFDSLERSLYQGEPYIRVRDLLEFGVEVQWDQSADTVRIKKVGELPVLRRNLKFGCKGQDVTALQKALTARGFDTKGIDSDFGNNTKDAVIALQRNMNLKVNGEVGQDVWEALGGTFEINAGQQFADYYFNNYGQISTRARQFWPNANGCAAYCSTALKMFGINVHQVLITNEVETKLRSLGWKKIIDMGQLEPGDVVFTDKQTSNIPGTWSHVYVFRQYTDNSKKYAWVLDNYGQNLTRNIGSGPRSRSIIAYRSAS
jgi:hypothetical protein